VQAQNCRYVPPFHHPIYMLFGDMSSQFPFTEQEADAIFSHARLKRLKHIYRLSRRNILLLHAQLSQLNGSIYASTSLFEIHFRNIITMCLDEIYAPGDWMQNPPFNEKAKTKGLKPLRGHINAAKRSAQKNAYAKLPHQERKRLKSKYAKHPVDRKKQYAIQSMKVSPNDLIPHLYLGFWRTLFSKTYEPHLWNRGLRNIFPDKKISRGIVSDNLETVLSVRNRVSHNEFIHPGLCHKYIEAITDLTKELGYRDKIERGRVYQFHAPYIDRIKLQLLELEHFLKICGQPLKSP